MKIAIVSLALLSYAFFTQPATAKEFKSIEPNSASTYNQAEAVTIEGYDQDCMEPQISRDGQTLFFNNSNAEKVTTHLYWARRTGPNKFKLMGLLPGTNSDKKDMAPTLDNSGNFYFTSLRSFDDDSKSLYCGRLTGDQVVSAKVIDGDIWPGKACWIDMDCGISADGNILIFSQTRFVPLWPVPAESDLVMANKINGRFVKNTASDLLLKEVNSSLLEYAPCLSSNGLELYFTRVKTVRLFANPKDSVPYIMVAKRAGLDKPFGKPERLNDLSGFVEAPTLTGDDREMFFHKKVGDRYQIYRALRMR